MSTTKTTTPKPEVSIEALIEAYEAANAAAARIAAMIAPAITAGNVPACKKIRRSIIAIGKMESEMRKAFDDGILNGRSFVTDFLPGVKTIRKPRDPKNTTKPASVFASVDIFEDDEDES
jgi:hypothetical protein